LHNEVAQDNEPMILVITFCWQWSVQIQHPLLPHCQYFLEIVPQQRLSFQNFDGKGVEKLST
jgi:hypothetical protein